MCNGVIRARRCDGVGPGSRRRGPGASAEGATGRGPYERVADPARGSGRKGDLPGGDRLICRRDSADHHGRSHVEAGGGRGCGVVRGCCLGGAKNNCA